MTPLYRRLAQLAAARLNCIASGNTEWLDRHSELGDSLVREHLPSGSGFDNGTRIAWKLCKLNKLVLRTSFHHMDNNGSYDGWTDHSVIITPDLAHGISVRVTGRDKRDIKEYIAEVFYSDLRKETDQ